MSSFNHPFLNKLQENAKSIAIIKNDKKYSYANLLNRVQYILNDICINIKPKSKLAIVDSFSGCLLYTSDAADEHRWV